MSKKQTKKTSSKRLSLAEKKAQKVILGAVVVAALGALAIMILVLPRNNSAQNGVGADGFSVFEIKGATLNVNNVASKDDIRSAFGDKAKSVGDVETSGVVSLNGSKGQTASYSFTSQKDTRGRVDIDVLEYKSKASYDNDNVFAGTGSAGKINNLDVRYLPAITLGPEHEYALLVTKDLKSYKVSMAQPNGHIDIDEVTAQDILKRIIEKAKL